MVIMIDIVELSISLLILLATILLWKVLYFLYILDKRFLDFPDKKYCCFCCDGVHGCGIVAPDWIAKSNATHLGT